MEDKNLYLIGAVQKTGKSLHVLAASAKQAAKYAKMYRRGRTVKNFGKGFTRLQGNY